MYVETLAREAIGHDPAAVVRLGRTVFSGHQRGQADEGTFGRGTPMNTRAAAQTSDMFGWANKFNRAGNGTIVVSNTNTWPLLSYPYFTCIVTGQYMGDTVVEVPGLVQNFACMTPFGETVASAFNRLGIRVNADNTSDLIWQDDAGDTIVTLDHTTARDPREGFCAVVCNTPTGRVMAINGEGGFGGAAASGNINEGSAAWFIVAGRQQVTTGQNWDGRISNFYFSKTMLGLAEARRITAQPVAYLSGLGR